MILDDVVRACHEFLQTGNHLPLSTIRKAENYPYPEVDSAEWAQLVFYFFKKNKLSFDLLLAINRVEKPEILLAGCNALEEHNIQITPFIQNLLLTSKKISEFVQCMVHAKEQGILLNHNLLYYLAHTPVSNSILSALSQHNYLQTQILQSCSASKKPEQYVQQFIRLPLDFIKQHEALMFKATIEQLMALEIFIKGQFTEIYFNYIEILPEDAFDFMKAAERLEHAHVEDGANTLIEYYNLIKKDNATPLRLQHYAEFKSLLLLNPGYKVYELKLKDYQYPDILLKAIINLTDQGVLPIPSGVHFDIPKIFRRLHISQKFYIESEKILQLSNLWVILKKKKINVIPCEESWMEISFPDEILEISDRLNELAETDRIRVMMSGSPAFIFKLIKFNKSVGDLVYKKLNELQGYSNAQKEMLLNIIKLIDPCIKLNNTIFKNIKSPTRLLPYWTIISTLRRLNMNTQTLYSKVVQMKEEELVLRADIVSILEKRGITFDKPLMDLIFNYSLADLKILRKIIDWIELCGDDESNEIFYKLNLNVTLRIFFLQERILCSLAQYSLLKKTIIIDLLDFASQFQLCDQDQIIPLVEQKISAMQILREEGMLESHYRFLNPLNNPVMHAQYWRLDKYYPNLEWTNTVNVHLYLTALLTLHEEGLFTYNYANLLRTMEDAQPHVVELIRLCHYYSYDCSAECIYQWMQDQVPIVDLVNSMQILRQHQLLTQENFQHLLASRQSLSHLSYLLKGFSINHAPLTSKLLELLLIQVRYGIHLSAEQQQILYKDEDASLISSLIYCQKIGLSYTDIFYKLMLFEYRKALLTFNDHGIESKNLGSMIFHSPEPLKLVHILLPRLTSQEVKTKQNVGYLSTHGLFNAAEINQEPRPLESRKKTFSQAQNAGRLTPDSQASANQSTAPYSYKR